MAKDIPLRLEHDPTWPQDGPRWAQDGPRWAQDGPEMRPRGPKMGPRRAQDGPKIGHKRAWNMESLKKLLAANEGPTLGPILGPSWGPLEGSYGALRPIFAIILGILR